MARAVALEVLLKYWNEQSYLNITLNEYLQNFTEKGIQILANDGKIEKGESGWKIQGTVTVIEDIAGPVPIPEKHEENQTVNEFN